MKSINLFIIVSILSSTIVNAGNLDGRYHIIESTAISHYLGHFRIWHDESDETYYNIYGYFPLSSDKHIHCRTNRVCTDVDLTNCYNNTAGEEYLQCITVPKTQVITFELLPTSASECSHISKIEKSKSLSGDDKETVNQDPKKKSVGKGDDDDVDIAKRVNRTNVMKLTQYKRFCYDITDDGGPGPGSGTGTNGGGN